MFNYIQFTSSSSNAEYIHKYKGHRNSATGWLLDFKSSVKNASQVIQSGVFTHFILQTLSIYTIFVPRQRSIFTTDRSEKMAAFTLSRNTLDASDVILLKIWKTRV